MAKASISNYETVRTTVTLPADLVKWSQQFVEKGTVPSRNALIVAALEHFLVELEQQEIDRQFATMAEDSQYRELSLQIAEDFAESDWEALGVGEEGQERK